MAMRAGITGSTSGTVFNVAGTRVGVHVMPPGSSTSSSSGNGAVVTSTSKVKLPPGPAPEVKKKVYIFNQSVVD